MADSSEILQVIFDYILQYKTDHDGVPPSRREITATCQISSTSQTNVFLRQLQDLGMIKYTPKQSRTIEIVKGSRWVYEGDGEQNWCLTPHGK